MVSKISWALGLDGYAIEDVAAVDVHVVQHAAVVTCRRGGEGIAP